MLQGADAHKADQLLHRVMNLEIDGKFTEALDSARELVEFRERRQGRAHWEVVSARGEVEAIRRILRRGAKLQAEYVVALRLVGEAMDLEERSQHTQALVVWEKVLNIRRKVLGEDHSHIARAYTNVADNLAAQHKDQEAAGAYRKALAIDRKVLGEDHPYTAGSCKQVATTLHRQGKYREAEEHFRSALAIYRRTLGEEDPNAAQGYHDLASNLEAQGRHAEAEENARKALAVCRKVFGEEHPLTASSYNSVAFGLQASGKHKEAEESYRKALEIFRTILGEDHAETARSYDNVAFSLRAQGRYREAEAGFRKAIDICRRVLGEEHQDTARSYNNLAMTLNAQGKYTEGEEGLRKALNIYRKVFGEEHPRTALSYNNVAYNLDDQGKYREAEEGYRLALAIYRKVLGEEHPDTARSYNNVAMTLNAQGRYREAEHGLRQVLHTYRKVFGEKHTRTASAYNNLAGNLADQGKHREADDNFRKALEINRQVLGGEHPDTAGFYNNFAANLDAQGRYSEAEEGHGKALEIFRSVLGEEHPRTALSYNNVAFNLLDQGKYKEAEESFRKALDIRRKALGEEHPLTATTCYSLAVSLQAQGRFQEAEDFMTRGADAFLAARLHIAAEGLDRAARTSQHSPLFSLAALLARNGKPAVAWQRYEEGLGRGLWDDLSARRNRLAEDQARQAELRARLEHLDRLLEILSAGKPSPERQRQREDLLARKLHAQQEWSTFVRKQEEKYGPVAGQVFDRDRIQAALPNDTALLGWLDIRPPGPKAADPNGEHWAFVLRCKGEPVCVRLAGSGDGGAWTEDDSHLPGELRSAVLEHHGGWQRLAQRLREQRLGPLEKHLAAHDGLPAVQHLIVLPSPSLAGVPVELLAEGTTVSSAPSGTLYAHLRALPKAKTAGLFAVADPVFEVHSAATKGEPLPPGGVLLTAVQPGSSAAVAGLRPNDVLLKYGDTELTGPGDLMPEAASDDAGRRIVVTLWRDGKLLQQRVRPGKLGVVLADKPAPEAVKDRRRLDRRLTLRGEEGWRELPGTRVEVASITRLFGDSPAPAVLTDSEASEQNLYQLAQSGALKKYRYLHLATHGDVDDAFPLRSAVILSRDHLPDPGKQLLAGKPVFDGRLTAEEVLRQWHLDCDLVTLSVCQTALGKYERGEGFVSFAQALTLCGSRSVCLSLWQVDDAATALLMQRFY
jgi:tetratricopeptide (TPR) repeat protein